MGYINSRPSLATQDPVSNNKNTRYWRGDLEVKNRDCFCRGPKLDSHHPYQAAGKLPVTPTSGYLRIKHLLASSRTLHAHACTCMHMHTHINIHTLAYTHTSNTNVCTHTHIYT